MKFLCDDGKERECNQLCEVLQKVVDYMQYTGKHRHKKFDDVNSWIRNYESIGSKWGGSIVLKNDLMEYQVLSFVNSRKYPARYLQNCIQNMDISFTLITLTEQFTIPLQYKAKEIMFCFYGEFLKPKSRRGEK